jgi:hypothetical protein
LTPAQCNTSQQKRQLSTPTQCSAGQQRQLNFKFAKAISSQRMQLSRRHMTAKAAQVSKGKPNAIEMQHKLAKAA